MTKDELVALCSLLYESFRKRNVISAGITRSDVARALAVVSDKYQIHPDDMELEDFLPSARFEADVLEAVNSSYTLKSRMGDYPANAQASWRWTMKLIGNISQHPELLDTSDMNIKEKGALDHALMVQDFLSLIQRAKFIFWNTDIFNTALNGAESFVGERFNAADFWSPTYYTYDKVQTSPNRENECNFGMLMLPLAHDDCNLIIPIGLNGVIASRDKDGTAVIDSFALEMMGHVQADELIDDGNVIGQQLSAAVAFLKMKVAAKERALLPRPERRRMKRDGRKEPELYTVSLRKTQGKAENAGTGELIERDSHWMVSGHWRRQWFPSVEKHAPLWIDGYIKGDTTKPFKASKKRVFAAVR